VTKYLDPSFNSGANSKKFRDNWDKVFGRTPSKEEGPRYCTWGDDDDNALACSNEAADGEEWCEYHLEVTREDKQKPTYKDALTRIVECRFPKGWTWDDVRSYAQECLTDNWGVEMELREELKE